MTASCDPYTHGITHLHWFFCRFYVNLTSDSRSLHLLADLTNGRAYVLSLSSVLNVLWLNDASYRAKVTIDSL